MEDIIKQARDMRAIFLEECYGLNQPIAINTEKFAAVVGKQTGISIKSLFVPDMGELRGMLVRFSPEKALVLISDKNNECWRRFTYIKEISHLYLEQLPADFNSDAYNQASALVDIPLTESHGDLKRSEISGVIAAMEIMIPEYLSDWAAHQYNVDGKSSYQIASMLKVPQKYVEFRMEQFGISLAPNDL